MNHALPAPSSPSQTAPSAALAGAALLRALDTMLAAHPLLRVLLAPFIALLRESAARPHCHGMSSRCITPGHPAPPPPMPMPMAPPASRALTCDSCVPARPRRVIPRQGYPAGALGAIAQCPAPRRRLVPRHAARSPPVPQA